MVVAIKFLTEVDLKGLTKAEKGLNKFSKTAGKLAGSLGIALGTTAITRYAKASVKAFMEDEAAATKLSQSLKNLGLAYATEDISKYIDNLTLATGVSDTELRPALQSLLQVTGSVTKSQGILSDAINISRGSTQSLSTVANDLAQAYVGNFKGLRKYNLGLTKAELAASSFVDIQDRLNTLFAGASSAYLATYAGQMQILSTSANEAKEIIGKSLVEAIAALGEDDSVANLATDMQNAAKYTADVVTGISALIDEVMTRIPKGGFFKKLFGELPPGLKAIAKGAFTVTDVLAGVGKSTTAKKGAFNFASGGGAGVSDSSRSNAAAAAKAELAAKKRQAELIKMQKATAKAAADALKLKKAGTLFDIEQAGIIAALKLNISKEDETRLKLQLAILTGNVSEASKLAGEVAKAQGLTKELVAYYSGIPNAKNPFEGWITTLTDAEAIAKRITDNLKQANSNNSLGNPLGIYPKGMPYDPRSGNTPDALPDMSNMPVGEPPRDYGYTRENPSFTYSQPSEAIINFNAPITTTSTEEFARLVQKAIQNNNRFGNNLDYAGAI